MAPIHHAASQGNLEEVMRLMEENLEIVDAIDEYDDTALNIASSNGHVEVVSCLLEQGAVVDKKGRDGMTALSGSCGKGHLEVVELLLSRGADPTIGDEIGFTPLMNATFEGHVDVVRCLARNKAVRATMDVQDGNGHTSPWLASCLGYTEIVKLLVDAGANPIMADRNGVTSMDIARRNGHDECTHILEVSLQALI